MGELKQRGRIWWIRYYRDGRRYEESSRSDKQGVARDLLRQREGDISKGVPVTARSMRLTFAAAAADVVADYRVNEKRSIDNLQRRIRLHLAPVFGCRRLNTITAADVRAFSMRRLEAGASHAEINRELAILKRAYRLAVDGDKYHSRVPKIPMLQERNVRQGFFDDTMVAAVLAHLPTAIQPVVQFAYVTGWRVQSEVLPLEWRQVDRETGDVRLDPGTTKNEAGRVFPFTDTLQGLFDTLWAEHEALTRQGTLCRHVFHRQGETYQGFPWCLGGRLSGRRAPSDARPRSTALGRTKHGAGRSLALCGDATDWAQD